MHSPAAAAKMRDFRVANAPTPDDPGAKRTVCARCGEVFHQWFRQYHKVCPDCAAIRMVEANDDMRLRRGPTYIGAMVKQYNHARSELLRLGVLGPDQPTGGGMDGGPA